MCRLASSMFDLVPSLMIKTALTSNTCRRGQPRPSLFPLHFSRCILESSNGRWKFRCRWLWSDNHVDFSIRVAIPFALAPYAVSACTYCGQCFEISGQGDPSSTRVSLFITPYRDNCLEDRMTAFDYRCNQSKDDMKEKGLISLKMKSSLCITAALPFSRMAGLRIGNHLSN
jgi:hypothetical protein